MELSAARPRRDRRRGPPAAAGTPRLRRRVARRADLV